MANLAWVVCLILCVGVRHASSEENFKLPSYIDVCYRDDPKVAKCLKKAIEKLVPIFKTGSRDFDLDSLDPLVFQELFFKYKSQVVGGSLTLSDIRVNGLSDLKVIDVRPKLDIPNKMILNFDTMVPYINAKSFYNLTGNIAKLPVKVNGFLDVDLEYLNVSYHVEGETKKIGEYDFLDLKKFYWRLQGEGIKDARIVNDNIIHNYPALNPVVKSVLTSSWKVLKDNLLPVALRETEDSLREIFSAFFKKYPYNILFPRRTPL